MTKKMWVRTMKAVYQLHAMLLKFSESSDQWIKRDQRVTIKMNIYVTCQKSSLNTIALV